MRQEFKDPRRWARFVATNGTVGMLVLVCSWDLSWRQCLLIWAWCVVVYALSAYESS